MRPFTSLGGRQTGLDKVLRRQAVFESRVFLSPALAPLTYCRQRKFLKTIAEATIWQVRQAFGLVSVSVKDEVAT